MSDLPATDGSPTEHWDLALDVMFGLLNLIVGVSSIIMNFLVFFFTLFLNYLKYPKTSIFLLRKYTQVYLVKSSINNRK